MISLLRCMLRHLKIKNGNVTGNTKIRVYIVRRHVICDF